VHRNLVDHLECPACHGPLTWRFTHQQKHRILDAQATCAVCGADYAVRDGIGVFLTPDLPRNDLWEQGNHQLSSWLTEHPEVEEKLMQSALDALGPADLFFRGLVHEERAQFTEAERAFNRAHSGLYMEEYLACSEAQFAYVVDEVRGGEGPIVDLASGRCTLVSRLARDTERPLVATDFSPRVLKRDREWLTYRGLYDRVSLLALDARRTPFRSESIETMTTNLGLPNIQEPAGLYDELRRIVAGRFLAISTFYPPDDETNIIALQEHRLDRSMLRDRVLSDFSAAGWKVSIRNSMLGSAQPTPRGEILESAGIDAFPVRETTLEWCTLDARTR